MRVTRSLVVLTITMVAIASLGLAAPAEAAAPGTLRGTVRDSLTGNPLPGAKVYAYGGAYNALYGQATTAANGTYTISLPKGSFKIRFDATSYTRVYSGGAATLAAASPVAVNSNAITTLDMNMNTVTKQAMLKGTVNGGGSPIPGVTVRAHGGAYGAVYGTTTTALDGSWSMLVPPGSFKLRFDDPSGAYARRYSGNATTLASATAVGVAAYQSATHHIDLHTGPPVIIGISGNAASEIRVMDTAGNAARRPTPTSAWEALPNPGLPGPVVSFHGSTAIDAAGNGKRLVGGAWVAFTNPGLPGPVVDLNTDGGPYLATDADGNVKVSTTAGSTWTSSPSADFPTKVVSISGDVSIRFILDTTAAVRGWLSIASDAWGDAQPGITTASPVVDVNTVDWQFVAVTRSGQLATRWLDGEWTSLPGPGLAAPIAAMSGGVSSLVIVDQQGHGKTSTNQGANWTTFSVPTLPIPPGPPPPAGVSGKLTIGDAGGPFGGRRVEARTVAGAYVAHTFAGTDGTYQIALPTGTYKVVTTGWCETWHTNATTLATATAVSVNGPTAGVDIHVGCDDPIVALGGPVYSLTATTASGRTMKSSGYFGDWSPAANPQLPGAVTGVSSTGAYAVDGSGNAKRLVNNAWQPVTNPGLPGAVAAIEDQNGAVVSAIDVNGNVACSANNGSTWTPGAPVPITDPIANMVFDWGVGLLVLTEAGDVFLGTQPGCSTGWFEWSPGGPPGIVVDAAGDGTATHIADTGGNAVACEAGWCDALPNPNLPAPIVGMAAFGYEIAMIDADGNGAIYFEDIFGNRDWQSMPNPGF